VYFLTDTNCYSQNKKSVCWYSALVTKFVAASERWSYKCGSQLNFTRFGLWPDLIILWATTIVWRIIVKTIRTLCEQFQMCRGLDTGFCKFLWLFLHCSLFACVRVSMLCVFVLFFCVFWLPWNTRLQNDLLDVKVGKHCSLTLWHRLISCLGFVMCIVMTALWNRAGHYIFAL